ncbi:MAG: hypothetical protein M3Z66_06395 [Chloroflexota bacterium]|nr:hypothetical protein [Chloroflexota bacterium]
MSNWAYVAIAYTVVWGALAVYALVLARRVTQARRVSHGLGDTLAGKIEADQQDNQLCETPDAR